LITTVVPRPDGYGSATSCRIGTGDVLFSGF
jgi:hypothetical protein